jgi:hypothetical protein
MIMLTSLYTLVTQTLMRTSILSLMLSKASRGLTSHAARWEYSTAPTETLTGSNQRSASLAGRLFFFYLAWVLSGFPACGRQEIRSALFEYCMSSRRVPFHCYILLNTADLAPLGLPRRHCPNRLQVSVLFPFKCSRSWEPTLC